MQESQSNEALPPSRQNTKGHGKAAKGWHSNIAPALVPSLKNSLGVSGSKMMGANCSGDVSWEGSEPLGRGEASHHWFFGKSSY